MALNTLTLDNAYEEIRKHIISNTMGTDYSSWYVGITSDPERRLFDEHRVNKNAGAWVYVKCYSDTSAREVEKALISNLNTKGDSGGGDESTIYVYAYVIKHYTVE